MAQFKGYRIKCTDCPRNHVSAVKSTSDEACTPAYVDLKTRNTFCKREEGPNGITAFVHIDDDTECLEAAEDLGLPPPKPQQGLITAAKYVCEDPGICDAYTKADDVTSEYIKLMCSDDPPSKIIVAGKSTLMKNVCKKTCKTCVSLEDRPHRPRGCVFMNNLNAVEKFEIDGPIEWDLTKEYTAICRAKPCTSDQDPTYATSREDSSGCTLSRAARQEREDAQYKTFYIAALSVVMLMEICGAIYLVIWLDDASRKDVLLVLIFGIRTFDMTSDWGTFRELYPRR